MVILILTLVFIAWEEQQLSTQITQIEQESLYLFYFCNLLHVNLLVQYNPL